MAADHTIYRSERVAASYARWRPPVHGPVCQRVLGPLLAPSGVERALDIGCGAGASTAALLAYAAHVVGADPYRAMLAQARVQVPGASFVQGRFEALPFEAACFQLVATAGAINYADPVAALAEVHRVLQPGGWFIAYDFSAGRSLTVDSPLPAAFARFRQRYPSSPGYALDLSALPWAASGLELISADQFVVEVPMSGDQYIQYILGDAGVHRAIVAGATETEIRRDCTRSFGPIFGNQARGLAFEAKAILATKRAAAVVPVA